MDFAHLLAAVDKPPLSMELRIPLSALNFLEFAIWGAWFVVLGQYLNAINFSRKAIGSIYATMSLGAIFSPMFVGAHRRPLFRRAVAHGRVASDWRGPALLDGIISIPSASSFGSRSSTRLSIRPRCR